MYLEWHVRTAKSPAAIGRTEMSWLGSWISLLGPPLSHFPLIYIYIAREFHFSIIHWKSSLLYPSRADRTPSSFISYRLRVSLWRNKDPRGRSASKVSDGTPKKKIDWKVTTTRWNINIFDILFSSFLGKKNVLSLNDTCLVDVTVINIIDLNNSSIIARENIGLETKFKITHWQMPLVFSYITRLVSPAGLDWHHQTW